MNFSLTHPIQEVIMKVRRGNVIRNKETNEKRCVFLMPGVEKDITELDGNSYDFICERPHEDGDYSYLCPNEYCRCTQ